MSALKLNDIRDNPGSRFTRKRVGRGLGSGLGKTSGKGQKGQKARSGIAVRAFEGGQMPIHRRLPKRGFKSHNSIVTAVVNTGQLQSLKEAGLLDEKKMLDQVMLCELGLVKKGAHRIKLLAKGDIKFAAQLEVDAASAKAVSAVQSAGGSVKVTN
ncbi:MAG: 50S ribosomal protein L15 [Alphaproteobacteria bacterium]|nr:50S ribosomal protein L15 [Alphaproteobacteria bacterium]OJV45061.1 MAG: 50S ribosomal protein L15 [Alphaproteobacteria bacterium 43-37]